MDAVQLAEILELHAKYLSGDNSGKRANLSGANLYGANLSGANLSRADLSGANLPRANLYGANLSGANLSGAFLSRADLSGANLYGANLSGAYLYGAFLYGADLSGANLYGANLSGTTIDTKDFDTLHSQHSILPEGSITGWKKINNHLIKLRIPRKSKRCHAFSSRKCRAEFAKVISIIDMSTNKSVSTITGGHDKDFVYAVGELVKSDEYDDNVLVECTNGIHFFITKLEAEKY